MYLRTNTMCAVTKMNKWTNKPKKQHTTTGYQQRWNHKISTQDTRTRPTHTHTPNRYLVAALLLFFLVCFQLINFHSHKRIEFDEAFDFMRGTVNYVWECTWNRRREHSKLLRFLVRLLISFASFHCFHYYHYNCFVFLSYFYDCPTSNGNAATAANSE